MSITIVEAKTKKALKDFVEVPFIIYKDNPYWVPPIKKDELNALLPEKNPCHKYARANFWVVYRDNQPVGRIGALIHHRAIEKTGQKLGRFTRLEFEDSREVVDMLFNTAETWLRENGMDGVEGPLGFTNLDHQGMLIEGFNYMPSIASEYHMDYYKKHLQRLHYKKQMDWVEFRLTLDKEVPEKAARLADMIKKRSRLKVVSFKKTKEIKPWAYKIFHTLNEAFAGLFSFVELSDEVIAYYINRYISAMNPDYVKVITTHADDVIGFIIGVPSLSEAMQKVNGKLTLFNAGQVLKAQKNPEVVDLFLTGVLPEYQAKGVSAVLINELQQVMIRDGVENVETTGIIETNHKAIQHWKNYQHIQHKRKRCFVKMFR